jgi:hypothetical protein
MPPKRQEPVWWKVIAGLLLIFVKVKNHIDPAANVFRANSEGEQIGMNTAMVVLIAIGCWLVYSGIKPMWRGTK